MIYLSPRARMRAGAALLAVLTAGSAGGAAAQAIGQATSAGDAAEIVVTGFNLQNQLSISKKRDADTIADFLVADEINRQPDYNIADAFRRAPGVFTIFDEDEGRYVGIRGLNADFTVAQLNGALIATAERGNRRVNLEAIPSSSVTRLEIFKSRTAEIEGNAIGGTINLVSRSAFDAKGLFFAGSAALGYTDQQDVPGAGLGRSSDNGISYRGEATFSTRLLDDTFGIVMAGSYLLRRRDQQRFSTGAYGAALGDLPTQTSPIYQGYPNTIKRYGGYVRLEARPSDRFQLDGLVSFFTQEDTELRYGQQVNLRGTQTVADQTISFPQGQSFTRFNDFFIDKPLFTTQAHLRWEPVDRHVIRAAATYSEATFHEPSNQILFTTPNNRPELGGSYTYNDNLPALTVNSPAYLSNASNYAFSEYLRYEQFSDDFVEQFSADYSFNRERGDRGFGIDAGIQFRENRRVFDEDRSTFNLLAGNTLNAANFLLPEPFSNPFSQYDQLLLDGRPFLDYFDANRGQFRETIANTAADYRFEEDVLAGYGQLVFRGDRFNVLAGLRWEQTRTLVERQRTSAGIVSRVERTNSYDNWLPSVTGHYDLTDQLRLRASWFRAIGRPNPIDLAGSESVTIGGDGTPQLSRGNPDLRAREADNFDASLEYYFPGKEGLISVAVFHKIISNEIFRFQDEETIDGVLTRITQPRNVADAKLTGFEVSFIQNNLVGVAGFLDGFGVSGNFSYFAGKVDVVGNDQIVLRRINQLENQPTSVINAAVFYNGGPFETRLTYARSSAFPNGIATSAVADADRFDTAFWQLDWTGRMRVSKNIQLTAEVRNITNQTRANVQTTPVGDYIRDTSIYGRTAFAGVAFRF